MGLESGSYISDLDVLNPASTDLLKQADDHLRLIKSVLKNTFPNITGPVTATQDEINSPASSVPVGAIMVWYGASSAIPSGFALCDGSTVNRSDGSGTITTPDLVDRVVMGAGTLVTQGEASGAVEVNVSTPATNAPVTGTTDSQGDHNHAAGTLVAAAPDISVTSTTIDYSINGSNTGPCVTGASATGTEAITGSTANAGAHTHTLSGASAAVPAMGITVPTVPPVLGLHYIMKV